MEEGAGPDLQQPLLPVVELRPGAPLVLQLHPLQHRAAKVPAGLLLHITHRGNVKEKTNRISRLPPPPPPGGSLNLHDHIDHMLRNSSGPAQRQRVRLEQLHPSGLPTQQLC